MKKRIAIWLVVEFVAVFFFVTPTCILRRDHVRAFKEWRAHPTPETELELARQKRLTERARLEFSLVVFLLLGGATVLASHVWHKSRTS